MIGIAFVAAALAGAAGELEPIEAELGRAIAETLTVHALLLSVRRAPGDDWRLYAFGPGGKPVLDAKFGQGAGPGTTPVALQSPEKGKFVLTLFDKYQARFELGAKAE